MYRRSLIVVFAGIAFGSNHTLTAQGQTKYEKLPIDARFLLAEKEISSDMDKVEQDEIRAAMRGKNDVQFQVASIMRGSKPVDVADDQAMYWFNLCTRGTTSPP